MLVRLYPPRFGPQRATALFKLIKRKCNADPGKRVQQPQLMGRNKKLRRKIAAQKRVMEEDEHKARLEQARSST